MAKYMGSYEALHEGGNLADALVDLTGGSVESFDLGSQHIRGLVSSGEMWHFVRNWFVTGCLLACIIEDEDGTGVDEHAEGILPNLAYGILDVTEVDGLQMVRIRNPWGESEWKGPFADHDQMWNKHPELKEKLRYEFGPDGTWWMRFEDWVTTFRKLHVCRLFPASYQQHILSSVWSELTAAGAPQTLEQRSAAPKPGEEANNPDIPAGAAMNRTWKSEDGKLGPAADPDSRWFNNPQFRIHLKNASKPVTLFVSLMQSEQNSHYLPTNLMLLRAKPSGRLWDCVEQDLLSTAVESQLGTPIRETTFELVLHPGETGQNYVLVAYIDQAKPDPSIKSRFYVRVFASEPIGVEALPPPIAESFAGEWSQSSSGGRRTKGRMESSNWCRNPQIFLNFRKPTAMKIVLERRVGKKRYQTQEITAGFTVTRLNSSAEVQDVQKSHRNKPQATNTATGFGTTVGGIKPPEQVLPELIDPRRKLQVLPSDWVRDTSYGLEDVACMFLAVTPEQGPLVVVPSLSDENAAGQFNLSVFSDRPLRDAMMLDERRDKVLVGNWTADTGGGCHLYLQPFEQAKAATWRNNPRFALVVPQRAQVHITLARCERPWRQQIAKDAVGCMLGFYVLSQTAGVGEEGLSRENVVAETTFVPSHEVSLDITLAPCTADNPYLVVPCTYEPGKVGEFMLRVCSGGQFEFEAQQRR